MGGYNSGRWHAVKTRTMVEECLEVSIRNFRRCKKFEARRKVGFADSCRDKSEPVVVSGIWKWGSNSVAFRGEMGADGPQDLHLNYFWGEDPVSEIIGIETTKQHFGGRRWWFSCPECNRRCSKIYLPPGKRLFSCRQCYRLTYRSCNESGRFRALEAWMIVETGVSLAELEKMLRG